MEPYLAGLFLEFHIGRDGVPVLFSCVCGAGSQVAILLVCGAVGLGPGIRIGVFVIHAHGRFNVLDARCVGVEAKLRCSGEALVEHCHFAIVAHGCDNHVGIIHILGVGYYGELVLLGICGYQGVAAVKEAPVVAERLIGPVTAEGGASLEAGVSKPAFLVFLLEPYVKDFLAVSALYA